MFLLGDKRYRAVLVVVVVVQVFIFLNSIFSDLKVKNEYYYLNETTRLADGSLVSNQEFERDNLVINSVDGDYRGRASSLSVFHRGDLDVNKIPGFVYFPISVFGDVSQPSNKFHYLVKGMSRYFSISPYESKGISYAYEPIFNAYYSNCENWRAVDSAFKQYSQREDAKNGYFDSESDLPGCKGMYREQLFPLIQASDDASLEKKVDYVTKNIDEKILQTFDRYYFHETSFVLAPLNEFRLGKPLRSIFSQYGFLSMFGVSAAMELFGGFSFPNYEKAVKLSYLAYYLCFLFVVRKVFVKPSTIFVLVLLYSIGFLANTYYFYQYPPGHAPLRHLFDLLVLYFVSRYGLSQKLADLFLAAFLVVVSIFTNKEYGTMLAAAFVVGCGYQVLYRYYSDRSVERRFVYALIGSALAFVVSIKLYPLAENPSSKYFLDGFYSFRVTNFEFVSVLASIFIQALLLLFRGKWLFGKKRLFLFVFSAAYSQCLYFYYVWGGGHAHFFTLLVIYLFPYMVFADALEFRAAGACRIAYAASSTVLLAAWVFGVFDFSSDYFGAEKVFEDHVTYKWSLSRAKGMVTTTDPAVFEDAVARIRENEPETRVFMISKYDDILSILSEKYSGTEFFEHRSMIVTKDEYRRVRSQLESADTIFVDNDIDRDYVEEMNRMLVWNMMPFLFYEHRYQRVLKLQELKNMYHDVIPGKYRLAERGKLISVYKKIRE